MALATLQLPEFIEWVDFAGTKQLHCRLDGAYLRNEQVLKTHLAGHRTKEVPN